MTMEMFALYIGFSVLWIVVLAMNISRLRIRYQIANGDGGHAEIKKAIRAHMNTLEHTLPFALLLWVLMNQGSSDLNFALLAFGFFLVRVLHSLSIIFSVFRLRQLAAGLNYAFFLFACVWVIANVVL